MVTIKDIAKEAQVTDATVSRILNNKAQKHSAKTITKILALAKDMGYVADDMARAIKTGKTKVIGFSSSTPYSENTAKIIASLSTCAEKHGYMIKIINGSFISYDETIYKRVVDLCIKNRLPALILHGISDFNILEHLKKKLDENDIELAQLANNVLIDNCLHVTSCDAKGIKQSVTHLHELGHRNFLFVSLELVHPSSKIRRDAYFKCIKDFGITRAKSISDDIIHKPCLLDKIFSKKADQPTAIVCSGDNIATFIKEYLIHKYGIKTPEDISIIGYGDFQSGQDAYPALTTIYEPFLEIGGKIIEKIVAKIEGRNFGTTEEFIDTKLIVRDSTAPATK